MLVVRNYFGSALAAAHYLGVCAFFVCNNPVLAQRWLEPISQAEESALTGALIRAIRAENWIEAVSVADRYRGSPNSGFSQYQAFAYAMTGRLDLVSELQSVGLVPSAASCSDESNLEYRDAVETIVETATRHRAVVIEELHWDAQQRLLLHDLLPRLREEGFTYFAAEDFEGGPEAYAMASYPGEAPGFHSTREPVFADAVRTAIDLGYRLVPYEASFPPPPEVEPQNFQHYRLEGQAENLYQRIFSGDAEAKAIIYAGVGWAREAPDPDFPGDEVMLARFKELSGIDPLSIDQTKCRLPDSSTESAAVIAFDADGEPDLQGYPSATFDLQVRHVAASYEELGRADWLSRLGRQSVTIPASLRPPNRLVIIEARLSSDPVDASPVDRIYLGGDEELPLLLPPGAFRITSEPSAGEFELIVVE